MRKLSANQASVPFAQTKTVKEPDLDKIYSDLEGMTVTLLDDPVKDAGGISGYVHGKLTEIRDKTEVCHRHLRESRKWLAYQKVLHTREFRALQLMRQFELGNITPIQRRGRSSKMVEAQVDQLTHIKAFADKVADLKEQTITWTAVVKILIDREVELKRANSDIRLQANMLATERHVAVHGDSKYAQKKHPVNPFEGNTVPIGQTSTVSGAVVNLEDV